MTLADVAIILQQLMDGGSDYDRGKFWIASQLANIHGEVSEAMEELRNHGDSYLKHQSTLKKIGMEI